MTNVTLEVLVRGSSISAWRFRVARSSSMVPSKRCRILHSGPHWFPLGLVSARRESRVEALHPTKQAYCSLDELVG